MEETKTRVRGAVKEIARIWWSCMQQDRRRQVMSMEDTVWQREFEEMFPFEETEDQIHAIEAYQTGHGEHKIMDRLICGDVGFGKTEVAIRAAFKAVQEENR